MAENDGWAIFNFTPRGKNNAYQLYQMAQNNPKWFCEVLTVDDTHSISQQAIQDEKDAGMSDDMVQQEFFCSFDLGVEGAYYSKLMTQALQEARITSVPVDTSVPVHTFWDLGIGDSTAIWFAQFIGQEIHLVDYYETSGEGLAHYARVLKEKNDGQSWVYGFHFAPHDIQQRELSSGQSRVNKARELGINFQVLPSSSIEAGIELVRGILTKCWFDVDKCKRGIDCIENYRKKYNQTNQAYANNPLHDWSSHGADAFRYLATAHRSGMIDNYSIGGQDYEDLIEEDMSIANSYAVRSAF